MKYLLLTLSILLLSSCQQKNDIECIKVGTVYISKICVMEGFPYGYTVSGEAKTIGFQELDGWSHLRK